MTHGRVHASSTRVVEAGKNLKLSSNVRIRKVIRGLDEVDWGAALVRRGARPAPSHRELLALYNGRKGQGEQECG